MLPNLAFASHTVTSMAVPMHVAKTASLQDVHHTARSSSVADSGG